ncbi:PIN domain-containing protein [Methylobacterium oryzisoli]|uniref:PIN domain-containing protein n=1 Tax=Methylobacterium oryzisoli TaxID=3385502 RepID=UPI0038928B3D
MSPDCFLDTNVLIYAALGRFSAPSKYERARLLIAETDFGISGQVLQEFFYNATRKSKTPLTSAEAIAWIETLRDRHFAHITIDSVTRASDICDRYRINYWDAAIVAAAERLGAPVVYSEDLNDGQTYGSVHVVNPFRPI